MGRKYYYDEHLAGYERLVREGKAQWNDLFEVADFDAFQNREFLESVLTRIGMPPGALVFEYGCGTGPAACALAARGFRVTAVDLVPTAIELARQHAAERRLSIEFAVADICELANHPPERTYDVVVDSYCLQSIVTDADRAQLYAAVRARLSPKGYYLISTAMYDPERPYDKGFSYDPVTGICRHRGVPHRRHLTPEGLDAELRAAGFDVLEQSGELGGDLVCRLSARTARAGAVGVDS